MRLSSLLQRPTRLILVRHGQTDLNDKDRIRGWHDIPLNAEGLKQADDLGKKLCGSGIDVVVTSDFKRAYVTAEKLGKACNAPVIPFPALRPWNVGDHTGKESKIVSPVLEHHAKNLPHQPLQGGESFNQFKERFLHGVEDVVRQFPGKTIALVTHHRGDMLMSAWEKTGMPASHQISIQTFLDWEKGIDPGTHRHVRGPVSQPSQPRQQIARLLTA